MNLFRYMIGIMTLGFVFVTHLIGFNNVRVLGIFWIPEFVLILYLVYSLIPFEQIPEWYIKIKNSLYERRKRKKVVRFKKPKEFPVMVIVDGLLITLIALLSLLLIYQL